MALQPFSVLLAGVLVLGIVQVSNCALSDREVIQVISLTKPLKHVPPVVLNVVTKKLTDPLVLSPTDDLTPLIDCLAEDVPVKVVILGFVINVKANVTKALINEFVKSDNIVITIHVDTDNIINLLQGATHLVKLLVPVFKHLPVKRTSIIAAGAGAHLGAAVLGQLPKHIQVQQIIALDPIMPLLETDLFLKLLAGRSPLIMIIHSSAGSYVPSVPFPPLVLPGAIVLYLDPNDLAPVCGDGPSQCVCRKGISFKLLLDALLGRLIVAPCSNIALLNFFAPEKCLAQNATVLNLAIPPPPGVYYAVIAALAKENLIYGLQPSVTELLDCDLDVVLKKHLHHEYALINVVRDLLILPITNALGAGLAPLNLGPSGEILPVVEVAGRQIGGFGETLGDLLRYADGLLEGLLGPAWEVVGDLGKLAGGVLYGLGVAVLGLPADGLYRGLGGVVLREVVEKNSVVVGAR